MGLIRLSVVYHNIERQLDIIRKAYDKTVKDFHRGISEEDLLPEAFRTSEKYLLLFDCAAVIGLLEYYCITHIENILIELNRVLKPDAKTVLDLPNLSRPLCDTMIELENYLGRPRDKLPSEKEFESVLEKYFKIVNTGRTELMSLYCLHNI